MPSRRPPLGRVDRRTIALDSHQNGINDARLHVSATKMN